MMLALNQPLSSHEDESQSTITWITTNVSDQKNNVNKSNSTSKLIYHINETSNDKRVETVTHKTFFNRTENVTTQILMKNLTINVILPNNNTLYDKNTTTNFLAGNITVKIKTTAITTILQNNTIEITTKAKTTNNSNSSNDSSNNTNEVIHITSIKDICRAFNIPLVNCTCEKIPQFCKPFGGKPEPPSKKNPVVRYTYNRTDTLWYAALGSIAAIIGVCVNAGVLLVSFVHRKSLARSNHLVALLSLFDCITCIFQFVGTVYLFWTIRWPYGLVMCKLIRGSDMFGSFVAVEVMLLICVERFVGIMYPFQMVVSMDRLMKALVCVAILSAVGTLVPLLMVVVVHVPSGRCIDTWRGTNKAEIYEWFILVFFFIFPVFIIFIGYGVIMRYLRKQSKSHVITTQEMIKQRIKRNRRVMYLLISIVMAFVVLTLPNRAIHLYLELVEVKNVQTYKALVFIAFVTYPLHSVVNPFIYSLVDKDFRNKLRNLTVRKLTTIRMSIPSTDGGPRASTTTESRM